LVNNIFYICRAFGPYQLLLGLKGNQV